MNSSPSTKFWQVMVLESDHLPQKLRPALTALLFKISQSLLKDFRNQWNAFNFSVFGI
jgi:hypothetical protein